MPWTIKRPEDNERTIRLLTPKERHVWLEEIRAQIDCKATLDDVPTWGASLGDRTGYGMTRKEALDDLKANLLDASGKTRTIQSLKDELEAKKPPSPG